MELQELLSFYYAVRFRSVSKAARHLKIAQPTVTNHLKKLEQEFNVILFDRIKRPIQLTSDGTAFYELVQPVMAGLEAIKIRMGHPERQGTFKVAAYPDLILYYLPQVIKEFRTQYPEVHITVLARPYSALMDLALSGEVDLVLASRPLTGNASLDFVELFQYDTVLITPLSHELLGLSKITLEDIAQWPLILLGPETYTRQRLEQPLRQRGLSYNIALEMDNMEFIKRYVEIGMGIAIGPGFALQPGDETKLGIVPLTEIFPPASVGVITLKGKFLGKSVRNFIATLVGELDHSTVGSKGVPQKIAS